MPKSKAPRKPFRGNQHLFNSKEFNQVQQQLGQLLTQMQGLQSVVLAMLQVPQGPPPPPQGEVSIPGEYDYTLSDT